MPLRLDNEAELREAQAALFNVNNNTSGWLLLNYVRPSTVHFTAGGEGDVEELSPHLEDDQIQYALVRLGNIQEKGTLKTTIRDVFITYIGPGVGIIEKGKKTAFLGDAQAYLQPSHADVTVLNKDNLNRVTLLDRSSPLSGSHVID
ncbi:MAG: coactosin family protein [Nostoc sp.]|uniref:coactosin family protein n=1 Tax=Nostoc sp. TaxID=1180 RepID=UPI002FF4505C